MQHAQFFVNGLYFWMDRIMDTRTGIAMSIPAVIHEPFSGALDIEAGTGSFFDLNGMSEILFREHNEDSLCFKKQYVEKDGVTPRGPAILYTMKRNPETDIWIGTWVRPDNEGIATMVLSQMPTPLASFADHNRVLEEVGHFSPDAEVIKRWHAAEQEIRESTKHSQECGLEEPHPDWEMVGDFLRESGLDYFQGDDDCPDIDGPPSAGDNPEGDSKDGDDLPF
jgi:hypothetical protein